MSFHSRTAEPHASDESNIHNWSEIASWKRHTGVNSMHNLMTLMYLLLNCSIRASVVGAALQYESIALADQAANLERLSRLQAGPFDQTGQEKSLRYRSTLYCRHAS